MSQSAPKSTLSKHCRRVLELLSNSAKPLPAYDILDSLRDEGIKAPPTVYRALDTLMQRGLAHKIESLNAFVACHSDHEHEHHHPHTRFAICRDCGRTTEMHDETLTKKLENISKSIGFSLDQSVLELHGICAKCAQSTPNKMAG